MTEPAPKQVIDLAQSNALAPESVIEWGKTLIVAPHPDDESLGCGGAIALLRKFGCEVFVLTMSDGTLSHPNSAKFPPARLRDLREREMRDALEILGVEDGKATFFRFTDRSVPDESSADFPAAVKRVEAFLKAHQPETILIPWRNDPHPDHRATWQIFNRAGDSFERKFRTLEYPIWLWEIAEKNDLPSADSISILQLEIESVISIKQRAVHAHVSQTTDLIDDDPQGFKLSPEVLAHFAVPFEIYLEEIK